MKGSKNEPSINGIYRPNGETENGRAVLANGDSSRVLYWTSDAQAWAIADSVGSENRLAQEPDGASRQKGHGPWHSLTWKTRTGTELKPEPSVTVSRASVLLFHAPLPLTFFDIL